MSAIRPVRRLGSGVVHWADVGGLTVPATVFGAPCLAVVPPVMSACGAELRGDVVAMDHAHENFDGSKTCPRCRRNPAVLDAWRQLTDDRGSA